MRLFVVDSSRDSEFEVSQRMKGSFIAHRPFDPSLRRGQKVGIADEVGHTRHRVTHAQRRDGWDAGTAMQSLAAAACPKTGAEKSAVRVHLVVRRHGLLRTG
jgi:hypothetical protein